MLSVTIGAVANLILDPLFIFGLHLGIKGAAIATIISQTLSAAYVFYFLRKKSEIKSSNSSPRRNGKYVEQMQKIS